MGKPFETWPGLQYWISRRLESFTGNRNKSNLHKSPSKEIFKTTFETSLRQNSLNYKIICIKWKRGHLIRSTVCSSRYGGYVLLLLLKIHLFSTFRFFQSAFKYQRYKTIVEVFYHRNKCRNFNSISFEKLAEARFCGGIYCLISGLLRLWFSGLWVVT